MADFPRFHIRCQGRLLGPVSLAQLERMERRGQVSGSDMVSQDRVTWCLLEDLEELHPSPPKEVKEAPESGKGADTESRKTAPAGPPAGQPPRRPFQQRVRPVLPGPVGHGYQPGTQPYPGSSGQAAGMAPIGPNSNSLSTLHAVGAVAVVGFVILAVGFAAAFSDADRTPGGSGGTTPAEANVGGGSGGGSGGASGGGSGATGLPWAEVRSPDGEVTLGLRSDVLDGIRQEQVGSKWCWAASVQMVFRAHGFDVTQEQIVQRTYGDLRDEGGNFAIMAQRIQEWPLERDGKPFRLEVEVTLRYPGLGVLMEHLKQGRPAILTYLHGPPPAAGHAVVVSGVSYREDPDMGKVITGVWLRDPSSLYSGTNGKRLLSPGEYSRCEHCIFIYPVE